MPMPSASPRHWYRVAALADGQPTTADLYIFDVIGKSFWDEEAVSATKFLADVQALPASVTTIRLHIASPGGNPFDAVAIANTLRNEVRSNARRIEVSIDGLAASAASIIAMAGDVVRMADNGLFMIHESWAWAMGNKREARHIAEMLESIDRSAIATYRWHSALPEDEIAALMEAVTWMDAETAKAKGFIDEVVPGVAVAARFRPDAVAMLGAVPDAYRERVAALVKAEDTPPADDADPEPAPTPAPAPETESPPAEDPVAPAAVIRACLAAGFPALAEPLVATTVTQAQLDARLTRARETAALCKAAKLDTLAAGYVQADVPIATVQAQLTELRARLAGVEIDPSLAPDTGRAPVRIDAAAIYARHNQPQPVGGATR